MPKKRPARAPKSRKKPAKKTSATRDPKKKVIKKAPAMKRTVQTRRSKKLAEEKSKEKKEKPKTERYNVWRKKSVYGPLYRRLESYKQKQMKEEAKEAAKEKIRKDAMKLKEKEQIQREEMRRKAKEEEKKKREMKRLENEEKKLKETLKRVEMKKRSLSKKTSKRSRSKKILEESESEEESEIVPEESSSIEEESASEESDSEELEPKLGKTKEVYIYKKGKLIPVKILNQESSDSESEEIIPTKKRKSKKESRKIRESRQRKKKNSKRLMKQIKEQQTRMETLEKTKERYCLIDFWEDFNNTVDLKNNLKRGRISSARGTRPRTYNFKLKKSISSAEYKIKIDDDLCLSCSCLDWRTKCKGLGIICKHLCYLMKYILKFPITDIEDNQIQDKLVFYKNLEFIKMDYNNEVAKNGAQKNKCVICYGDLLKKRGWTWIIDFENTVSCPDCKKPVHRKCAEVWLKSSENKNCIFCRSNRFQYIV